jgi:FkbM family methyltransferase
VGFKRLKFYLQTKSPAISKLKVILWFLIRTPLRIFLGWKKMESILKDIEKQQIISKMQDTSVFIHSIGEIANLHEIYGEKKQELMKFKKNPKIVLDVGAHIGILSVKFAKMYKKVKIYAIEPEKGNFKKLITNIKLNKLEKTIYPAKIALLDRSGITKLGLCQFDSGSHSLFIKNAKSEKVKVTTLDQIRRKIKRKIDLIKIDTEGSEYKILIGGSRCLKKDKPKLIIETHPQYDKMIDEKILTFLKQLRYKFKKFSTLDGSIIFAW